VNQLLQTACWTTAARVVLSLCCIGVLCLTLSLGLWPFHAPVNQVDWIQGSSGIRYGRFGTVQSDGPFLKSPETAVSGLSIEVWTETNPYQTSATLLSFSVPGAPVPLKISQSSEDLLVQTEVRGDSEASGTGNLRANRVFQRAQPAFITITSGPNGTRIYSNGIPTSHDPAMRVRGDVLAGRLILGDFALQPDSWRGDIRGLALYRTELTDAQVQLHFRSWTTNRAPELLPAEQNVGLFLFDEHQGRVLHNKSRPEASLHIPSRYQLVDKILLEPFWHEFSISRSFAASVVRNIVGFVPLGCCFSLYLSILGLRRAGSWTVLCGTLVSITIEVTQWFLPTRDSGTTDLFTNTFGTWLGILLQRFLAPRLLVFLPCLQQE
jgi:VanZ family protein